MDENERYMITKHIIIINEYERYNGKRRPCSWTLRVAMNDITNQTGTKSIYPAFNVSYK